MHLYACMWFSYISLVKWLLTQKSARHCSFISFTCTFMVDILCILYLISMFYFLHVLLCHASTLIIGMIQPVIQLVWSCMVLILVLFSSILYSQEFLVFSPLPYFYTFLPYFPSIPSFSLDTSRRWTRFLKEMYIYKYCHKDSLHIQIILENAKITS